MSNNVDRPNPGQARVWLKSVVNSDLLDKLPSRSDDGGSRAPRSDALALLNELRDVDSSGRTVAEILADVRRFRAWVESRRKHARRIILAEGHPADDVIERPLRRREEPSPSHSKPPRRSARPRALPPRATPAPRSHPLYDDWLDG